MKTVLVVDDEQKIREVLLSYLRKEHFRVLESASGEEALAVLRSQRIDLLILDLMLPGMDGETVCREVRKFNPVPILMLTAKVAQADRISGLSIGADDYMIKPFDPNEVVARVKAILRRSDDSQLLADVISFNNGHLRIDSLKSQVYRYTEPISLTPSEYKLLLLLAKYPQRRFPREELVDRVMGYGFDGDMRIIDQHVKNVRQKIEADPRNPRYIVTLYGFGYRFGGEA
ncbi:response regulator transcription factor [Paenibacillus sp. P96]|uniref:Response regulator transcription factor n=1 Tax=Paenibacillus zeirhizosphaerae TaxID=2987519 RepID=A0ABT9FTB7_9BACL|nr:response regulator transcription factor [Paenibacillus sp. P96]MDP4097979.1 response regulator transcription factor [Paenibacillus sp. P96]